MAGYVCLCKTREHRLRAAATERIRSLMTTTPNEPIKDEDIETVGGPLAGMVPSDADGTDGTDADGTDGTDADGTDGTDADGTDGTDADGTDGTDADGTDA
jgi:hypothetical protein